MSITGREKAEFNELYQQAPELVIGAGAGLILDGNGDVALNPDGTTIEVSGGNVLRIVGLGVDSSHLSALSVTTGKLDNDSVNKEKIAADIAGYGLVQAAGGELDVDKATILADIAGDGLTQAVGGELDVGVDDSSIEINTDLLRVKALGITDAMLTANKWTFKSGNPENSAAAAEPNTIYAGTDFLYVCKSAGWGSGGENWMRVALAAF